MEWYLSFSFSTDYYETVDKGSAENVDHNCYYFFIQAEQVFLLTVSSKFLLGVYLLNLHSIAGI